MNIKFSSLPLKITIIVLCLISSNVFAQIPNCANYTAPLNGANGNGGRTTLTWTAPSTGTAPTGYKLFLGTDAGATNIVNGTNIGNVFAYNADNLNCNTTYYWKIVPTKSGDATGCAIRNFVIAAPTTPLTSGFGNNSWTTFVYNSTDFTNYVGYYTRTGTPDFSSTSDWNSNESPSGTTVLNNYLGCRTSSSDNYSFIHKRQGFASGTYQIQTQHDDQGTLLINGSQVYQQGYVGSYQNAWKGTIGATTTIELRVVENTGGANGMMQFVASTPATSVTPGVISSSQTVCNGATVSLIGTVATSNPGANACSLSYQWQSSSNNLTFNNIAGATTQNYTTGALSTTTFFKRVDTDACGNSAASNAVQITVNATPSLSSVPSENLIAQYNFFGNANDMSGSGNNGTLQNAPTSATDRYGNISNAYTLDGSSQYISTATSYTNPSNFSLCIWFKTNISTGGRLIGFGTSQIGSSASYDRMVYMANNGTLFFGVNNGSIPTINTSVAYNDNTWHFAVASLSSTNGMKLYVDGVLRASNSSVTSGENYTGFWKIGYDNTQNWNLAPSSNYFNGTIDDVLIYSREITSTEVSQLYSTVDGATGNSPVCVGSSINLTSKTISNATYSWTGPNGFTSTSQNPSISNATTAMTGAYAVTATVMGCASSTFVVTITVNSTIAANSVSNVQTICSGSTPFPLTGSTPTGGNGSYTYQWESSTTSSSVGYINISGATSINYSPGLLTQTTWYRRSVASGGCTDVSAAIAITVNSGQWLGATSNSWNTASNWCGGVPVLTTDVVIPAGTLNAPQIPLTGAIVKNLTINSGATLTLPSASELTVKGNLVNNGTFVDNGATTIFSGTSSQGITNVSTLKNVTVNNASGVVLNSNMSVSGLLTLTSGALNSSGRLSVNLTTGNIDKTGSGSITGNITLVRNASELITGWHYLGSPLSGTTFNDLNDNVTLTTANFYSYHEGAGNANLQERWRSLLAAPSTLPLSTDLGNPIFPGGPSSLMAGYALKFPSAVALDMTGTYAHGSGVSYSTGAMSYTDGGQAGGNGWQLIANPFPSYIDWNSASVTTSNVEAGITYYNKSGGGSASYLPATITPSFPEASTNGGSPYIPAMQALWVQIKPAGNGVITVGNNARIINPNMAGYPSAPSYYRAARSTAQCFKLVATNSNGSDETCLRFGKGATTKFDSNIDMNKFGNDKGFPSLYTVTDTVEYAVNSLPELSSVKEVNLSLYVSQSGEYKISIKDLLNMEDYSSVNLYDKQTNRSQNLMLNDTYSFAANKGDADNRFVINFKPEILTNTQTMALSTTVDIFSNISGMVSISVSHSTSGKADVMVTNVLGQEVYKEVSLDVKSSRADIKINNIGSGIYIVKAIVDGRSYAKEVFVMK